MIKFNYTEAIKQAKELQAIAAEIEAVNKRLTTGRNELSGAWKGDSASLFLNKAEKLGGKLQKTANNLDNVADGVYTVAKTLKAAEDAAKETVGMIFK